MEIALIVIGLILVLGGYVYSGVVLRKACKEKKPSLKEETTRLLFCIIAVVAGGALAQLGIQLANGWQNKLDILHQIMGVAGGGLLMGSIGFLVDAFVLRFYHHELEERFRKRNNIILFVSIAAVLLFFILFEEGVANAWEYPLPSGIQIDGSGIHLMYPNGASGGFKIAWYGIFILTGFLVSYFISDHKFYKEFGKHGILENCLIVVFIFGILGARIWYVVGNWNGDPAGLEGFGARVARGDILSIFAFWEGGLTILGGVIAGIVSGWIYMKLFRKYVPVTFALDVVVPAILVAQFIGRWGNFFNHEVYGAEVSIANGWWWLPTFIQKEMGFDLAAGNIYVPLFLVEGLINLGGYFLIAIGIPALWDKVLVKIHLPKRAPGVLAGFYLIFYGVERMVMEPLRDKQYNMGQNGSWSFWNAMIYVILGIVLIVLLQFFEAFLREKWEARRAAKAAAKASAKAESEPDENPEDPAPVADEPAPVEKEAVENPDDNDDDFLIIRKKDSDGK